jgi:hypothetical protein
VQGRLVKMAGISFGPSSVHVAKGAGAGGTQWGENGSMAVKICGGAHMFATARLAYHVQVALLQHHGTQDLKIALAMQIVWILA